MSASATPKWEAAIADADNDLEDVESLREDMGVAYGNETVYLGMPSPPSPRRQRV